MLAKQENLKDAFLSSSFLFLHSFYNHLHSQPESVGMILGITVLVFPRMLSDCGWETPQ